MDGTPCADGVSDSDWDEAEEDVRELQRKLELLQGRKHGLLRTIDQLRQTPDAPPFAAANAPQNGARPRLGPADGDVADSSPARLREARAAALAEYTARQADDFEDLVMVGRARREKIAEYVREREEVLSAELLRRIQALEAENRELRAAAGAGAPGGASLGLQVSDGGRHGDWDAAEVLDVDGPAADAGLRPHDVVVGLGWRERADTPAAYRAALSRVRPGDVVEVDVYRGGRPLTVRLRAGAADRGPARAPAPVFERGPHRERRMFQIPVMEKVLRDLEADRQQDCNDVPVLDPPVAVADEPYSAPETPTGSAVDGVDWATPETPEPPPAPQPNRRPSLRGPSPARAPRAAGPAPSPRPWR